MIALKAALAASLALPLISATMDYPGERTVHYPLVHQVMCDGGNIRGTAFRIGKTDFISVAHVTRHDGCKIDGKPITVTRESGEMDTSEIDVPLPATGAFKVNCGGFIPGHWYYAIGYARGEPKQTLVTVYATYMKHPRNGERVLIGPVTFIPGMSGGPVLNEQGEVVGTVNMLIVGTPVSLSREMKEAPVCQSS